MTFNLGFLRAQVRLYDLRLPRLHASNREWAAKGAAVVRWVLPTPRQVVAFAGLGLVALVELIEWPVAVAIGLSNVVMNPAGEPDKDRQRQPSPESPGVSPASVQEPLTKAMEPSGAKAPTSIRK
ncbi:hypothetical protein JOF53_007338 [Crossiella equi]|uniref:Uncharacterized protein n=1 Tax=Crossiella equi TaxID=130796 RepID=A0ABS5APH4_9PSEU|nr:hypothetical protein [Crossiella equi]